ncbi:alpha/beta hydrolase family protein [Alcaligenes sp. WGS1538]|uniref:alpha/beta hydrolase family protein n=1 Tax=Alcaligenes sp. WGS1538 TaxID=3366811 RepID=UPI00372D04D4
MILSLLLSVGAHAVVPDSTAADAAAADAAAVSTPPRRYDIRDFFQNPRRSGFRLSDHGKMIGFMEPAQIDGHPARQNIFVQELKGSEPVGQARRITAESQRDIAEYFWKGDDTVIYAKDVNGDENYHVIAVNVSTGEATDLTPLEGVRAGVQDDLPDDPDHVLVVHNGRNPEVFDVYKVNVRTGRSTLAAQNPGDVLGWSTDHEGRVRLATALSGVDSELRYRDKETEPFRSLIRTDFRTEVSPLFFHADNQRFYALSNRGRDTQALVLIDPSTPDQEERVFELPRHDLMGAGFSRLRKVLTSADYHTDKPGHHFFDPLSEKIHEAIARQLPGYEVAWQDITRDERKFIVASYSDRTPGARYLYDADSNTLHKLADINTALPEADMAPMQPIQFTARDGMTIHGYLTLPLGRPARNLPVVVNPHGGPWARDYWGFNPEAQFLANRGYAVLQINFRSSTGYGRRFWEAGFGQWGLAMQDDITDGVQWLIDQKIADPKRIGIYGASYGGYATLAGIVKTPDLYAAAVDYVGVSNLLTFMNTIPPYWKPFLVKMQAMVGDPVKDKARLEANSPALHADRIVTPLFIAQGAHDPRVNKAESDQMVAALKARGVEVEYMVKDNEGHGFHNDENKFEFYEHMERFLAQHLKP